MVRLLLKYKELPPGFNEQELIYSLPKLWEESLAWLQQPSESWTFVTDFPPNVAMSNVTIETFYQILFFDSFAIFCQFKILKNILHFSFWQFYQLKCLQFLKLTISNTFEIFDNTDGCYDRSWLLSMLLVESTMWTLALSLGHRQWNLTIIRTFLCDILPPNQ